MTSPWKRAFALPLLLPIALALSSACRGPAQKPPAARSATPEAKTAVATTAAPTDPRDCAAQRVSTERWLAELAGTLKVEQLDDEDETASDAQPHLPKLDPLPPRYADKLALMLQKALLCQRGARGGGTWGVRYERESLSTQPPGDVLLPWALTYVGSDGKQMELGADLEDNTSAPIAGGQHEAEQGTPPQRPRFLAAVAAKYYITEHAHEDGELSLPESLELYDYDGDGVEEAIVTEHSVFMGRKERTVTIWTVKHGRIEPYSLAWHRTAEAARDVDGDGRPDLLYRPYWGQEGAVGAQLALAHSLPDGSFSTHDATTQDFAAKQPPPVERRDAGVGPNDKDVHKDALASARLLRMSQNAPTGMLCKREYERTRALLATVPQLFFRRHLPNARAAADGLADLLRRSSFCVPSQQGAWSVSFSGYQLGARWKPVSPYDIVAPWGLSHLGLDGKRINYKLPPPPAENAPPNLMLPLDDESLINFEYYTDDQEQKDRCRQGYHLPSELRVVDYDGKGEEEVIFAIKSDEENCASEKFYKDPVVILTLKDGQIVPYDAKWHLRYDSVEDLDGDGRPDLVYRPYRTPFDLEAQCPETHDCDSHDPFQHGPAFLAHALPQGGFSTTDQVAKDYAKRFCPQRPRPIARNDQSLVCARLWGATAKAALAERFGDSPCSDCEACANRTLLKSWAERTPPLHLP